VTVWRLERVRLLRTMRWIGILGPYLLFGISMPILTRYQDALLRHVGGGVTIVAPEPTPAQAIAAYLQNAMQIALLVSVLVAAGSLAFDARPEWAVFLRTRAHRMEDVLVPKVVVNAIAISASFTVGLVAAWVLAGALIGHVPVDALVFGALYGALYLVFVCALVAFAASLVRSVIGASGMALVVLIVLPLVGQLHRFSSWVPSALVGSPTEIAMGEAASSFLRAAVVAVALSALLVWVAARRLERREI
jgi:ABC-2 type transport system permease protein